MKVYRKKLPFFLLLKLGSAKNVFKIIVDNSYMPLSGKPIIFAANHSNCFDFPITSTATKRHLYPLAGKQRMPFLDRFFLALNGIIYADRLDHEDTSAVKEAIILLLNKGHSICWYPEGTWNLTDNLLVLPLKWGIISVARQADAQIIPMVQYYDRTDMTCTVRFGNPMAGKDLDDNATAIQELRDSMATLYWDLMSRKPVLKRKRADLKKLKDNILMAIDEYPSLEPEYEKKCVYGIREYEDVVPSSIVPKRETAFLFSKKAVV
jgi:1-acyl-sn-glycerol-3-phosphate acyltransferase